MRRRQLRRAAKHQHKLEREDRPWATALASYVAAQRARMGEAEDDAAAALQQAVESSAKAGRVIKTEVSPDKRPFEVLINT